MKFQFSIHNNQVAKIAFAGSEKVTRSIGKSGADITLDHQEVSRVHAQLIYDGEHVFVMDAGSTNGTFVNGNRIQPSQPVVLKSGDLVSFSGSGNVTMKVTSDTEQPVMTQSGIKEVPSLQPLLEKKAEITIGRIPECDLVLAHDSVSRKHATIKKSGADKYIITDLGSLNGIFVNGKRIDSAEITADDQIFIGRFQLSLKGAGRDLSTAVAIQAKNVIKQYPNGYVGLHESSFSIPSGGVVAIMGPSGCGKSTLLKVLNGDSPASSGNVMINGLDLVENYAYLKTQIGYVPQDDIVHRQLTVEQSLYYAAKLRLEGISDEQVKEKTDKLLSELNITHIRKNLVSAISGGQRKRVSIAVELLSDPTILFLDEPTSPLDPQTIEEFLGILRNLSRRGTSVIMVTHKPEDLEFMDSVIFMAEGGHLAYYGAIDKYREFFHVKSTVEVYENLSGEKAKQWKNKGNSSSVSGKTALPKSNAGTTRVNSLRQFGWLVRRYFRIKTNDRTNTAIMLGQAPIIACLQCLIFDDVRLAVLFLMTVSAIWFGVNNAAREIVDELPIYKRERMFNVRIIPYILSKVTVIGFFSIIQCIVFNLIIWLRFKGHEVEWENMFMCTMWMFFITVASSLFGLLISAISDTSEKVMSIVPIAVIPQIMLAGSIAKINNSIVEILSYFTFSRWGTEGFTHQQKEIMEYVPAIDTTGLKPVLSASDTLTSRNSYEFISGNYMSQRYHSIFDDWAGTMKLDVIAIAFIAMLCFVGIWLSLRKKDSIA